MVGSEPFSQTTRIKPETVKVHYMPNKGIFRKFVGGRMFYLGSDNKTAQTIGGVIVGMWRIRKEQLGQWREPEDFEFISMLKQAVYSGTEKLIFRWNDLTFELRNRLKSPQAEIGHLAASSGLTVLKALDEYNRDIVKSC